MSPESVEAFSALPQRPRVTVEIKFARGDADDEELQALAESALREHLT